MQGFCVEYRKISQLPTCLGNERLCITSDGRLYHSRNVCECELGELWSDGWHEMGRLGAEVHDQLAQVILRSGLLELDSSYWVDENVEGGRREELDVTIGKRRYHFLVQNNAPPEFRYVVKFLWGIMWSMKV